MKFYELAYLISPNLLEQEVKDFLEKINSFIQKEGGVLEKIENFQKRKLGYLIKPEGKEVFSEAYLADLNFHFPPDKLKLLEKRLKSDSQILRYLIFNKTRPRERGRKPKIVSEIQKPKEKKVELKELEKKLEEILGK